MRAETLGSRRTVACTRSAYRRMARQALMAAALLAVLRTRGGASSHRDAATHGTLEDEPVRHARGPVSVTRPPADAAHDRRGIDL